ncbi:MAG TPA: DUF2934 domain-containing protein [Gammaproteobacteria bacterium]
MARHIENSTGRKPAKAASRPRTSRRAADGKAAPDQLTAINMEMRHAMIAEAAYYHAEKRGFAAGNELQDWFEAESEIDMLLPGNRAH